MRDDYVVEWYDGSYLFDVGTDTKAKAYQLYEALKNRNHPFVVLKSRQYDGSYLINKCEINHDVFVSMDIDV